MADEIQKVLLQRLPDLQDNGELLKECVSICELYNLEADDLYYKLEVKLFNSLQRGETRRPLTREDVEAVKSELMASLNSKRARELPRRNDIGGIKRNEMLLSMMRRSAHGVSKHTLSQPARSVLLNAEFKGPSESDREERRYKYMYEKISDRSEVLDERIDEFGEMIRGLLDETELSDPSSTSEEDVVVVGRICGDAENPSLKLTDGSVFLESSRMMGAGARVPLHFSPTVKLRGMNLGVSSITLFPGEIVALKGRNGGGGTFVVDEILGIPALNVSSEPAHHKGFTMAMTCGPYSKDRKPDSKEIFLDFSDFKAFLNKMSSLKPSVILLLGPFIDALHPLVKSGDLEQFPDDIFEEHFRKPIDKFLETSKSTLVLIQPGIRDLLSDHPVFPQRELDIVSKFENRRNIRTIPNPCRFSINGVTFGSTSVDVLLHMRNNEFTQRGVATEPLPLVHPEAGAPDLWTNMCKHLLVQRSFYPIFPAPVELSSDVNLDISHSAGLRMDPGSEEYAPDVLFLPSKFKQFKKIVDSTWAINSSFLSKGKYALLTMQDTSRENLVKAMNWEIVDL
ncbi:DNA polymerase subunit B [Pyrrhoderma noxium]|uniref:DNA polymerase alpha subunit B n=1 Tax=Pyrrhoderma noxium TaxID=2282107 RepID=A0A286UQD0_9AGAM|nr:DNA polymerase subunit B [Pyrrhoderma noxium]